VQSPLACVKVLCARNAGHRDPNRNTREYVAVKRLTGVVRPTFYAGS
jgi:hypothetical protein